MTESTGSAPPTETTDAPSSDGGNTEASESSASTPAFPTTSSGNRSVLMAGLLVFILLAALLIAFIGVLRHWFALHTGTLHGGPDVYYNFWSGFGSDLGEATLISAVGIGVYTGVRKVNCHTKGCWRIGHHALEGTPYILCRHHHPEVPNRGASHDHILNEHHNYKATKAAEKHAGH